MSDVAVISHRYIGPEAGAWLRQSKRGTMVPSTVVWMIEFKDSPSPIGRYHFLFINTLFSLFHLRGENT